MLSIVTAISDTYPTARLDATPTIPSTDWGVPIAPDIHAPTRTHAHAHARTQRARTHTHISHPAASLLSRSHARRSIAPNGQEKNTSSAVLFCLPLNFIAVTLSQLVSTQLMGFVGILTGAWQMHAMQAQHADSQRRI